MNQQVDTVKVEQKVESETPQWAFPNATSTAEAVINGTMLFCAEKMQLENVQAVLDHLRQRNTTACSYCQYSIAKQVGDSLGALDKNVKAVYILDYDATPQDICFAGKKESLTIHLIVWAERKTSALQSLVDSLDRALVQGYSKLMDLGKLEHLLDVQVVDDTDIANRVGFGAMLSSLHQRPIQVWER